MRDEYKERRKLADRQRFMRGFFKVGIFRRDALSVAQEIYPCAFLRFHTATSALNLPIYPLSCGRGPP